MRSPLRRRAALAGDHRGALGVERASAATRSTSSSPKVHDLGHLGERGDPVAGRRRRG